MYVMKADEIEHLARKADTQITGLCSMVRMLGDQKPDKKKACETMYNQLVDMADKLTELFPETE